MFYAGPVADERQHLHTKSLLVGMLLLALALLAPAAAQLRGFVLPQTFADTFGAKCLDGTPPAFAIAPGASNSSFIVFLEGGGWCSDVTVNGTISNCFGRAAGGGGSSNGCVSPPPLQLAPCTAV